MPIQINNKNGLLNICRVQYEHIVKKINIKLRLLKSKYYH